MFTRIDLLPIYDADERDQARSRWDEMANFGVVEEIKRLIRDGAGENFLESDFESGRFSMLRDQFDLRGILLTGKDVLSQMTHSFKAISFCYGSFFGCTFRNANFFNVDFAFAKFHKCVFVGCTFSFSSFYGSTFEESRFESCDFPQGDTVVNADFHSTSFDDCFFVNRTFFDCRFDEETAVSLPLTDRPHGNWEGDLQLHKASMAEFYKGCKEAYRAGEVMRQSRRFHLLERQAITRHNTKARTDKFWSYLLEITTGYGLLPTRIVATMVAAFGLLSIVPVWKLGSWNGLLLSAGAFFTFGANADKASLLGSIGKALYIVEPFVGVSLVALFVTILARYWFSES